MKRIILLILGILSVCVLFSTNVCAADNHLFLCMHADSSMAYQSVNDEPLDYVEMRDSGNTVATAKIINDSTYLPFRYIAESAGLIDATGDMQPNTFKYEGIGTGRITISIANETVSRDVNIPFEYVMDNGQKIEYEIVNINGSLYFPMRYMAHLIDGYVDWGKSTGNIYFMTDKKLTDSFLIGADGDKKIKPDIDINQTYNVFDNTLGYPDIYLQSDGVTVSSVDSELNDGNNYYSSARIGKTVYYVDKDYKVHRKQEDESTGSRISFYTTDNESIDPDVENILVYNNKLYGIALNDDSYGYVFAADLNGRNYKRLTQSTGIYNLILREYAGNGYIFCADIENAQRIHRINLLTGTDDIISITDKQDNNLIQPIDIVSVSTNHVIVSEWNGAIDIISLSGSIYENNSITGKLKDKIAKPNGTNPIKKISSLNYDTDNELVYFINVTDEHRELYCYDILTSKIYLINTSMIKRRISIIRLSEKEYRIYYYSEFVGGAYKYETVTVSDNGTITINDKINIER